MKNLALIILVITGLLFSTCKQSGKTDDQEKLKAILIDYFDGIKMKDFQKMKDLTTSDFVLFEDGRVFNNDSLIAGLSKNPNFKVDYKFEEFVISIGKNIGNMRYFNHGDFTINDTLNMPVTFLESATFRKVDNTWKMEFLHSTVKK